MDVNLLAKLVEKRPTWFAPCAGRSSAREFVLSCNNQEVDMNRWWFVLFAPALVCLALGPPAGGSDKKECGE